MADGFSILGKPSIPMNHIKTKKIEIHGNDELHYSVSTENPNEVENIGTYASDTVIFVELNYY